MRRRFVTTSVTAPCSGSAMLLTLHRRHAVSLDLLTSHTEPLNPPAVRCSRCPCHGHFTLCPSTLGHCDAINLNIPTLAILRTTAAYVLLGSWCGEKVGEKGLSNCMGSRAVGRYSSVGIATRYGLDGRGIESRWGRDFSHPSRPTLGPTQPSIQRVPGFIEG
jgi:hypothetical protein